MVTQQPSDVAKQSATKSGYKVWRGLAGVLVIVVLVIGGAYLLKPAETPYARAVSLVQSGKAAAALPILEELSRQQPDNAKLFPWLAQAYLRTDRLAEGRVALDTALRLNVPNPSLSKTVLAYVNYYQLKGEYEDADLLFQAATAACPAKDLVEGRAMLYFLWGEAQLAKELDLAVKHLEQSYELSSELPERFRGQLKHKLSEAYRQQAGLAEIKDKDDSKASAILERSLQVTDEPATRMALAAIYSRQKRTDQAILNYQIVAKSDPNNLEARHHLIDLLCVSKDYASAQVALTDLVDKEKSVENFQLLANIDLKLGNYAGAVRAYEDAISLRTRPDLLKELLAVLNDWSSLLLKQHKNQEALAVKGHADRVADQLSELTHKDEDETDKSDDKVSKPDDSGNPIALSFSRIWLAKGSLTPEGEIQIRNVTGKPISDLTLKAVFYDNTARRANGSVALPVATPESQPFASDATRKLYFSCPNIIKADHQLAVIIYLKGRLLKEFPVVKL
jgi:tetratricopeptide (TPR) repeat protein